MRKEKERLRKEKKKLRKEKEREEMRDSSEVKKSTKT